MIGFPLLRHRTLSAVALVLLLPVAAAQDSGFSRDYRIKPEQLGLPKGSTRTSEPFVTRIYKTDDNNAILQKQPDGYPFTVTSEYTLKDNEDARVHGGVDLASPAPGGKARAPLDFKAGVYGVVLKAGDGPWGTISVQIADGSLIQYLHTTFSHVKVGDIVAPDTLLGATGRTGTSVIHLHIQAKDKFGNPISPELAFRTGQQKLESKEKLEKPNPSDIEFDPDTYLPVKPRINGKTVSPKAQLESKWVSEVIGEGGRVDIVLGEFPTYRSAAYCSQKWDEAHPKDLRLTREREVKLGSGK
jgi:murein DD-endopeptidase MepM/ murein hydrolase activator NlpD